jgi:hypothetical protein
MLDIAKYISRKYHELTYSDSVKKNCAKKCFDNVLSLTEFSTLQQ